MKRVTVQMIADSCGLSKSTVAYVLREPVTCRAAEKTRQLVQETARKLGYHQNFAARALSTRRYQAIGLLFPTVKGYYGELMMALDGAMRRRGYHGICSFWENGSFQESLESLCCQGIDGLIAVHNAPELRDCGVPAVVYGYEMAGLDSVYPDKQSYVRSAVDYLTGLGYSRIGYIGSSGDLRYSLLVHELESRGLPVEQGWFQLIDYAGAAEGFLASEHLLSSASRPDAVIVHSDLVAQGLYHAARGRLRIPEDLAVLGYDNLEASRYLVPSLTSYDPGYDAVAEFLLNMMMVRISDPDHHLMKQSVVMKLVERDSVPARL